MYSGLAEYIGGELTLMTVYACCKFTCEYLDFITANVYNKIKEINVKFILDEMEESLCQISKLFQI